MNENILKPALSYFLGFVLSCAVVALGFVLVEPLQSGLPIMVSMLCIVIAGVTLYTKYESRIAFGMLSTIPLFIVSVTLFVVLCRFFE